MPLLNKQPFIRSKPPPDLDPDEEVFFCEPTKEVFRDYDKFFERMILCNSLLWSCEMTGKSGLTYLEAADSEKTARRSINCVPKELKQPLLFLCSRTRRTNFHDLFADIFTFVKDRFFKGEAVELKRCNQWWPGCTVTSVCIVGDVDTAGGAAGDPSGAKQAAPASRLKSEGAPAGQVLYYVFQAETGRYFTVRYTSLRRDKSSFSKERLRVLLKHWTRPEEGGFLTVRPPVARSLGLESLQWKQMFVGPAPVFVANKAVAAKAKSAKPKPEQVQKPKPDLAEKVKAESKKQIIFDEQDDEPLSAVQLEIRQRWEEERKRLVELRAQERDKRRLRKKQVQDWLKEWSRPREDLICEDHKELPVMAPVHTRLAGPLFGGCLHLLEFLDSFGPVLELADTFPTGLSLPVLERALCDTEVAGPLSDLLQVLLRTLVELQKEEDEEAGGKRSGADCSVDYIDPLTVTEVLRRHLTAGDSAEFDSRWRYQQRGGYTDSDNPAVQFRLDHPEIVQQLSTGSVHDLSPGERLAVLECLVGEILTTAAARDLIDEADNKLKEARAELRTLRLTAQAFQRGMAAERVTERREDRQRQQQEQQQQKAADTAAGDDPTPPVLLPEIDEAERQRRRQQEEKTLADYTRKEAKLVRQIHQLNQQFCVAPLGRDRAYRRYWLGRALPGLFIEHDDCEVGPCLSSATPHNPQLSEAAGDKAAVLRHLLTEQLLEMSKAAETAAAASGAGQASPGDKENTPKPPPPLKTYSKKTAALTEKNQEEAQTAAAQVNGLPQPAEDKQRLEELVSEGDFDLAAVLSAVPQSGAAPPERRLLVCTAEGEECPVHSTILPRTSWSFVPDLQHLEQLVSALNERGQREVELRQAMAQINDVIRQSVERCPVDILAHHEGRRIRRDPTSNGRDPNLNFPAGTPVAEIQELLLRDMILECEEKIRFGCLGTVQVSDLSAWRQALVERGYDRQCDTLSWAGESAPSTDASAAVSGASTPGSGSAGPSAAGQLPARARRRLLVRSLASAVLQLAQGVDRKYLKEPLGDSEALERWQSSLMSSTSLSQLFLHFAQLESSVQWSKSALNARCKVCRKKSDPEKMLLCDGCDKGFHMFCLTPKMKSIPRGDWFCSACRPKERPKSPKKKRRAFTLDEEAAGGDAEEEPVSGDKEKPAGQEEEASTPVPAPAKRTSKGAKKSWESAGGSRKCWESGAGSKKSASSQKKTELTPAAASAAGRKRRSAHEVGGTADQLDCDLLSRLLGELRQHPCSPMFLRPVQKKEAPSYYQIVKEPMDFGTMRKKLDRGEYGSGAEFVADAGLVFSNCCMYNDRRSDIYKDCGKLRRFFERRGRELGLISEASGKRARRSH